MNRIEITLPIGTDKVCFFFNGLFITFERRGECLWMIDRCDDEYSSKEHCLFISNALYFRTPEQDLYRISNDGSVFSVNMTSTIFSSEVFYCSKIPRAK
jgi:hypothetical protein